MNTNDKDQFENKLYKHYMATACFGCAWFTAVLLFLLSFSSCSTISHNIKVNADAVVARKEHWQVKHNLKRMSQAAAVDTCSLTVKR